MSSVAASRSAGARSTTCIVVTVFLHMRSVSSSNLTLIIRSISQASELHSESILIDRSAKKGSRLLYLLFWLHVFYYVYACCFDSRKIVFILKKILYVLIIKVFIAVLSDQLYWIESLLSQYGHTFDNVHFLAAVALWTLVFRHGQYDLISVVFSV